MLLIIDYIYIRKYKNNNDIGKIKVNDEINKELYDKSVKHFINWLFILFIQLVMVTFSSITLIFNSKINEILELLNYRLFFFELVIFFLVKNYLKLNLLYKIGNIDKKEICDKELKKIIVFNVLYYIFTCIIYYFFEKIFVLSPASIFVTILSIIAIIYNFTSMNKIIYKKRKPNRIVIGIVTIILFIVGGYSYLSKDIWLVQPYINSVSYLNESNNKIKYDDNSGIYVNAKYGLGSNNNSFQI